MYSTILLASENARLQTANEKQKAKRQGKRLYIVNSRTLTVAERVNLVQIQKELQSTIAI